MRRLAIFGVLVVLAGCAAPAAAPRSSQVFPVYFSRWSALIDAPALATVQKVADMVKSDAAETIVVTGYADPEGGALANQLLSQTRAQVVMDQLVANGVPAARVTVTSQGSVPFAQTAQESRRVVIEVDKF